MEAQMNNGRHGVFWVKRFVADSDSEYIEQAVICPIVEA